MTLQADPSSVPPRVIAHPSMMSPPEKALLYTVARDRFRGDDGIIVDAGLFLGASTNAFATALKDSERKIRGKPIHSYDVAVWVRSMDRYLERPAVKRALHGRPQPHVGKSFEPLLRDLLSDHLDIVDLRIGDIVKLASADDRPIDIAFYDCLKDRDRDWAVFRAFAPHYRRGTVVLQQDYFYFGAPDHRVRQELLSPYFRYLGAVRPMAAFELIEPIPIEYFARDPVLSLSSAEKARLLEQAAARAPSRAFAAATRLSVAVMYRDLGERAQLVAYLDKMADELAAAPYDRELASVASRVADLRRQAAGPP